MARVVLLVTAWSSAVGGVLTGVFALLNTNLERGFAYGLGLIFSGLLGWAFLLVFVEMADRLEHITHELSRLRQRPKAAEPREVKSYSVPDRL